MTRCTSQCFSTTPRLYIIHVYNHQARAMLCESVRARAPQSGDHRVPCAAAASDALGQATLPSFGRSPKIPRITKTDHQFEFLSFFLSFSSFRPLCNPSLWLIHTSARYLLLIYSHKYFLCFYIWWSVTDWTAGFKQKLAPYVICVVVDLATREPVNEGLQRAVGRGWGVGVRKR